MTGTTSTGPADAAPSADEIDALMDAARVLVGVSARSVVEVEDQVTLPQLRVLVMVGSRGPLNLGAVATGLGIHPSNATRACDRLVAAGLLDRRDDPADRRNLALDLTEAGHALVAKVVDHRRAAIADILARMPPDQRRALVPVLQSFAAAAGEIFETGAWTLGWPTPTP